MQELTPKEIITTITNLKTGEEYKTEEEWRAKECQNQRLEGMLK